MPSKRALFPLFHLSTRGDFPALISPNVTAASAQPPQEPCVPRFSNSFQSINHHVVNHTSIRARDQAITKRCNHLQDEDEEHPPRQRTTDVQRHGDAAAAAAAAPAPAASFSSSRNPRRHTLRAACQPPASKVTHIIISQLLRSAMNGCMNLFLSTSASVMCSVVFWSS